MREDLRPAVFLDRDGTLIVERSYLADPDGVVLVPGATTAIRSLRDAGFAVVVVTNQSGIAKGLYSLGAYRKVAARLDAVLAQARAQVDGTYFCPHHPDTTGPCACRKPAPGMYLQAAVDLGLDPRRSWYVGDKVTDVLPALELGGRGILVRTGYGVDAEGQVPSGVPVLDHVQAAADFILGQPASGSPGR